MITSIIEDEGKVIAFTSTGGCFEIEGPFPLEDDQEPISIEDFKELSEFIHELVENAVILLRAEKLFTFVNLGSILEQAQERVKADENIFDKIPTDSNDLLLEDFYEGGSFGDEEGD